MPNSLGLAFLLGLAAILCGIYVEAQQLFKEAASSQTGAFKVTIYPQAGQKVIGEYHSWVVSVEDSRGQAVEKLNISVSGGMAAHGHGLPTKPQMTKYLGSGNYLVEGLLFNMTGEWTLQFLLRSEKLSDRVQFTFEVDV